MGLERAIASGRERRTPWRGKRASSAFDKSCRPHGGCPWCEGNRLHTSRKREEAAKEEICDVGR